MTIQFKPREFLCPNCGKGIDLDEVLKAAQGLGGPPLLPVDQPPSQSLPALMSDFAVSAMHKINKKAKGSGLRKTLQSFIADNHPHWSQSKIAHAIGVSTASVNAWASGRWNPNPASKLALEKFFAEHQKQ